jgi:catechol 2,3-dioxygenase-like lactoylglutathione lyase family enzyme
MSVRAHVVWHHAPSIMALLSAGALSVAAQGPAGPGQVRAIEIVMFVVADLDRSVYFYRVVLGMEMPRQATKFFTIDGPNSDFLNTSGSFRYASLRAPGSPLRLDLIEYKDTERKPVRIPRFQDAGAASLVLFVRDIDSVNARLKAANARTITNGQVVQGGTAEGRARVIFAQDPDGFFVGLSQRTPTPENNAPADSNIIADELEFTVADVDQTLRIYQDVLGFTFPPSTFRTNPVINQGSNTPGAQVRRTQARIPGRSGSPLTGNLVFLQYKDVDHDVPPRSRIPDPGTAILSIVVPDLGATPNALKAAGLELVSRKPLTITNNNSSYLIFRDPNNIFVEVAQHN